ncbi:SDR family NAD(P)-dependent oxidoreductase [Runella slithyformis]|uniref:Estradiol 17-beta-dehydrogenase n=1 Tax=Runella slithyformis (strain ATCC 29530 / DSM 19594 / LMG 11500 / NCIMB 11436 / LSU 4) TaxID=761193 RepID=A0A7U3ZKP3_RUNSL|nr:SDR family oxidoreductase [Runella slithyformis]AEI49002.1 Estradiol 17-beta-dehydrogenase [Runella slithyformis DSM 19594]
MATKQQYALVTGATAGIGYELAKLLAEDGYNLVIVARGQDGLDKTVKDLTEAYNVRVIPTVKDLFDPKAAFELYEFVTFQGIHIDILVNDAGQGQYGEFIHTDIQRELDIIQLNISSLVVLTKLFLKDMVARGNGKILNLASIASKMPGPLQAVYHGTKAFVHSFTEAIREEVKDSGVTVTSLLPGATATDFFNKADMTQAKIVQDGKLSDPAEVAKDGYDALMSGDDMVVSGLSNKMQVAMSNFMPDEMVAANMHKQHTPKEPEEK